MRRLSVIAAAMTIALTPAANAQPQQDPSPFIGGAETTIPGLDDPRVVRLHELCEWEYDAYASSLQRQEGYDPARADRWAMNLVQVYSNASRSDLELGQKRRTNEGTKGPADVLGRCLAEKVLSGASVTPTRAERRADPPALIRPLATQCESQRRAALTATFGESFTQAQADALDSSLSQSGIGSINVDALRRQWEVLSAGADDSPGQGYVECVYRERILQLDPLAELTQPQPPQEEEDIFDSLPRREAAAGAAMLANSADPALRAQRQRQIAERRASYERELQARRERSAAIWSGIAQATLIGVSAYAQYESARLQQEAVQQQAATAALMQQQAALAAQPQRPATGSITIYPPMSSQPAGASVEGQADSRPEPAGQRIYDTAAQYQASLGTAPASGGRISYLDPKTGAPCVHEVGRTRNEVPYYFEYSLILANDCDFNVSVEAQEIPVNRAMGRIARGVVYGHGQQKFGCLQGKPGTVTSDMPGCAGFGAWQPRR